MPVPEQIAILVTVNGGIFDEIPLSEVALAEAEIRKAVTEQLLEVCQRIQAGEKISDADHEAILNTARRGCE